MRRWIVILLAPGCLSGCLSLRPVEYIQVNPVPAPAKVISVTETQVNLRVVQEPNGCGIVLLHPRVDGGNVYLWPGRVSDSYRKTDFTVDLSHRKYPVDWKDHLYWEVTYMFYPFIPFGKVTRYVYRLEPPAQ